MNGHLSIRRPEFKAFSGKVGTGFPSQNATGRRTAGGGSGTGLARGGGAGADANEKARRNGRALLQHGVSAAQAPLARRGGRAIAAQRSRFFDAFASGSRGPNEAAISDAVPNAHAHIAMYKRIGMVCFPSFELDI